jgi:hypothetical protein
MFAPLLNGIRDHIRSTNRLCKKSSFAARADTALIEVLAGMAVLAGLGAVSLPFISGWRRSLRP